VFAIFVALMLVSALLKRALAAVLLVASPRFLIAGIAEITGNHGVSKAGAVLASSSPQSPGTQRLPCCWKTPAVARYCPSGGWAQPGRPSAGLWPMSYTTSNGRLASAARRKHQRGQRPGTTMVGPARSHQAAISASVRSVMNIYPGA
jgi:hypothetical protein